MANLGLTAGGKSYVAEDCRIVHARRIDGAGRAPNANPYSTFHSNLENTSQIIGTPATGYIEAEASLKVGAEMIELQKRSAKSIFPESPRRFSQLWEKKEAMTVKYEVSAFAKPVNEDCHFVISKASVTLNTLEPLELRKGAVLNIKQTTYELANEDGKKQFYFIQRYDVSRDNVTLPNTSAYFVCKGSADVDKAKQDFAKFLKVDAKKITFFQRLNTAPARQHVEAPDKLRGVAGDKD